MALLLAAAAAMPMLVGEDSGEQPDVYKIGVLIYRGDDTYISDMMDCVEEFAADLESETGSRINVNIFDSQGSQSEQNNQAERLIALNYDVLCVNLVDRTSAAYIIEHAMDADTPVVFFNREPVHEDMAKWDKLYYVGSNAAEDGRLQGKLIVGEYNRDPSAIDTNGDGIIQYIMIEGEVRHQDAVLRTEGSIAEIRDSGIQVEKLDGGIANWQRSQAAALAESYFMKYGDAIELIIANNDDMALGAHDAVERLGINFRNIVGVDGTPQGRKALTDRLMLGTVDNNHRKQAKLLLDISYALACGRDPAEKVDIPADRYVRAESYIVTSRDLIMSQNHYNYKPYDQ